jgi:exosome complex RNA-binding protein Rrp42 (RNase PH superfamily)
MSVQGGSTNVVDLTEEEEACCSSSSIHVAVNAQGIVCGIHKPGMAAIQPGRVMVTCSSCCPLTFTSAVNTVTAPTFLGIVLVGIPPSTYLA